MAYRLHYSDYSTGTGPPDPAEWTGPQGPMGAPGPPGPVGPAGAGFPEAPVDGTIYGRGGAVPSWAGVLALTGGTVSGPLNYTATGGTTVRSAQDRGGSLLTVEDFGAVGDGTADDSNAFDAYAAYLRAQIIAGKPQNAWVLGFGRVYYVTRSIDCTNFHHFRFDGNHSHIVNADLAHPAIDFLGSSYCTVKDLYVSNGSQASPGLVGIIYGMYQSTPNAPSVTFVNVESDGYFTRACMQNCDSETNLLNNVVLTNRYTSGTPGSSYCFLADGMAFWDLNSRYVTDTRTRNTAASFIGIEATACTFQNVGDGSVLWEGGGGSSHHYIGGYMNVAATVPVARFINTADNRFRDFVWNVHSEFNPSCIFLISGSSSITYLTGWRVTDHNVMLDPAGFLFKADTGITQVWMTDAVLMIPQFWRVGSKVFDQPSIYIVSATVTMSNASIAAWTPPTYGFVRFITDSSRSAVTINTDGIKSDINGADIHASTGYYSGALTAASGEVFLRGDNAVGVKWNSGTNSIEFDVGGTVAGVTNAGSHTIAGTQVLRSRITGWGAASGGSRAAFAAGSATLPQTAAALAQLISDLTAHGLIGP